MQKKRLQSDLRQLKRALGRNTMIRQAVELDFRSIDSFDPFSGDRNEDIKERRVFVYTQECAVCGFVTMSRSDLLGRPYIQYLAVDDSQRRKGIALKLLEYVELQHVGHRLFISTESINKPMQSLLDKRSYVLAGEIPGANLNGSNEIYYYTDVSA